MSEDSIKYSPALPAVQQQRARPYTSPFAVSKREAFRVVGMPRLVQRWLYHGWVEIVRRGGRGRETIIDFASLERAYERYKQGDEPPLLPSEQLAHPTVNGGDKS